MKTPLFLTAFLLCAASAFAGPRLQVTASTAPVRARADSQSALLGQVPQGTVLFATGPAQGGWTPVEPPPDVALWVNRDFVEGTRVIARSVQLRTGPGLEHDVAGTLSRGATVMKLDESGEWMKIAPPSSASVWVETAQTVPVADAAEPIREVEPVSFLPVADPAAPQYAATTLIAPSEPSAPAPEPLRIETVPTPPRPGDVVDPSKPVTPFRPAPVASPAPPRPVQPVHPVQPIQPVRPAQPIRPVVHPAPVRPAAPAARPAIAHPAPAPRPPAPAVAVSPALVAQLSLRSPGDPGRPVRVQGELRNAPFAKGSPSHYRLVPRGDSSMACLVHGDPARLRPYVGKSVAIRGKAYPVAETDLPVVVVGEIAPAP
jgi:hypothetical protein